MNNMNFIKNNFIKEEPTRIASKVIQNNTGVVSINQIRNNMQNLKRGGKVSSAFSDGVPIVVAPQQVNSVSPNNKQEVERMRMQALKNIGKKW